MCPAPVRLAAALALAALGAACGKSSPPAPAPVCLPLPPQASALPTFPTTAAAGQSQAISFGVKNAGDQISLLVPAGTASVTIVEQAASPADPLTVLFGSTAIDNTPVPINIDVAGVGTIFNDVNMPPPSAFRKLGAITVLDPLGDPTLATYFFSAGAWTGALTLPDTSRPIQGTAAGAGVPAGTWTVTVSDWAWECSHYSALGCTALAAPSAYDVTAILKPAAAPASSLRVAFYLVTNTALNAANVAANLDVQRMQWAIGRILSGAGIAPTFQYGNVPLQVRLQYATGVDVANSGVCGTLGPLLELAGPGNQLNVFLVDRIKDATATAGTVTVGLDPIVPGAASFGGTPASGVVVSMENLSWVMPASPGCAKDASGNNVLSIGTCGDDLTAAIVAHEAGHFMGLYHTTDFLGSTVDPIADTPTCFCPTCKPQSVTTAQCQGVATTDPTVVNPYYVMVADCLGSPPGCGGGDNLMFWLLDVASKGLLTAGQAAVMRASPLVE